MKFIVKYIVVAVLLLAASAFTADIPAGVNGFKSKVLPFFKTNCIKCHGPKKSKGKITLHTINGDLSKGQDLKHWEKILEAMASGEMPPEDEKQPTKADRIAVAEWIDKGLRNYVITANKQASVPTTRRLTNIEYQNTVRDLIGFELKLIDNLPEDPLKPYKFNNTASYMLMGPEQVDRYKENARKIMASVIVDPAPPKIHKTKREWKPYPGSNPTEAQYDEIGGRRGSPGGGMGLKSWPKTGEFRVKIKAAGIFPKGVKEIPLRMVMGYGLGENSSTLQVEELGLVSLKANLDNPETFEFIGRIENFPARPRVAKGKVTYTMTVTPQNIYDDGRLMDNVNRFKRPRIIVKEMEFEGPVFKAWPPKYHTDVLFESPMRKSNKDAYVKAVLKRFMTRAFRRPVSADEVVRYHQIYKLVAPDMPSFEAAMRETLAMVLISPDFLYHTIDKTGNHKDYEIASKLSYFMWGTMPDKELLDLAKAGKLKDDKVIAAQATRMLKDERVNDFTRNFVLQWLSISKSKQVKINQDLFPRFLYLITAGERRGLEVPYRPTIRDYMEMETTGFFAELIRRNASALNIVDSDFAYLNQPLAYHYGVEGVEGHELRPVKLKPEHRLGGFLTQGSVLIGNGTGSAPHPIYRAVWLREAILGDHVADPPANVPDLSETAGESAEKALTIKDLLKKHRQVESCNDCHVRLDPWGIPFEQYNAIGKYQPKVPKEGVRIRGLKNDRYTERETVEQYKKYLKTVFTEKIDATARVPHGPEVNDMEGLKAHILKSRKHDVAKNVLRRLLEYAIGRQVTYRDRYILEELLEKSKKNDYKLQDMIISVCLSKPFRGAK